MRISFVVLTHLRQIDDSRQSCSRFGSLFITSFLPMHSICVSWTIVFKGYRVCARLVLLVACVPP